MFELPPVLPKLKDMTVYQLILFLEERGGFQWLQMPKRPADRIAITYRPRDASTPRFWCTGQAKVNPMYLQALAQASVDASFDVLHAQKHVYDLELLGYDVSTNAQPKLALDDVSAESPRRNDCALMPFHLKMATLTQQTSNAMMKVMKQILISTQLRRC